MNHTRQPAMAYCKAVRRSLGARGNGGPIKILQNDVLGPGFQAPSGSDLVATGNGGVHATAACHAGGRRGRSLTQRGCGQSSLLADSTDVSSASRVPALRHLTPRARVWRFAQDRRVHDSLQIRCVPAKGRTKWKPPRLPLADAMVRARPCAQVSAKRLCPGRCQRRVVPGRCWIL